MYLFHVVCVSSCLDDGLHPAMELHSVVRLHAVYNLLSLYMIHDSSKGQCCELLKSKIAMSQLSKATYYTVSIIILYSTVKRMLLSYFSL